jgi:hypothetical protein
LGQSKVSGSGFQQPPGQSKVLGSGLVFKPTRLEKGKAVMVEDPRPILPKPTVSKWVAVQPALKGPGSTREKLPAGSSSPAVGSVLRAASTASSSSGGLPAVPSQCFLSPINLCSSEKSSGPVASPEAPGEEVGRREDCGFSAEWAGDGSGSCLGGRCSGWVAG